jgi:hypothetical protein
MQGSTERSQEVSQRNLLGRRVFSRLRFVVWNLQDLVSSGVIEELLKLSSVIE